MGIGFSFRNNVQVLSLSGVLAPSEESAVRLKLDEKINQGRKFILFQLEQFDGNDEPSRNRVLALASFCMERKVLLVFCGLDKAFWPKMVVPQKRQPEKFVTETEAFAWIQAVAEKLAQKQADAAAPPSDPEEEHRKQVIADLLKKYEAFQNPYEFDPFHLKSLAEIYKKTPSREAILELEKAVRDLKKHIDNSLHLKQECEQLAKDVMEIALLRKLPLRPDEQKMKQAEMAAQIESLELQQKIILNDLERLNSLVTEADQKSHVFKKEKDLVLLEAQEKLRLQHEKNQALRDSYAKVEAKELADLKALKSR